MDGTNRKRKQLKSVSAFSKYRPFALFFIFQWYYSVLVSSALVPEGSLLNPPLADICNEIKTFGRGINKLITSSPKAPPSNCLKFNILPPQKNTIAPILFSFSILLTLPLQSGAIDVGTPSSLSPLFHLFDKKSAPLQQQELVDTYAFQRLPKETQLDALKDLMDSRMDRCIERGEYWEQCFMFGESDGGSRAILEGDKTKPRIMNGLDYQLISPMGAINPSEGKKPPTW